MQNKEFAACNASCGQNTRKKRVIAPELRRLTQWKELVPALARSPESATQEDAAPIESTPVTGPLPTQSSPQPTSRWARGLGLLHPSHAHNAFSATVVLIVSTFLSRIIGLVMVQYIVLLFG